MTYVPIVCPKSPIVNEKSPTFDPKKSVFKRALCSIKIKRALCSIKRALYSIKRALYSNKRFLYSIKRALYSIKRASTFSVKTLVLYGKIRHFIIVVPKSQVWRRGASQRDPRQETLYFLKRALYFIKKALYFIKRVPTISVRTRARISHVTQINVSHVWMCHTYEGVTHMNVSLV